MNPAFARRAAVGRTVIRLQDAALAAQEEALFRILQAIFHMTNFGQMQRSLDAARKRLAKENRARVDAEGWIV